MKEGWFGELKKTVLDLFNKSENKPGNEQNSQRLFVHVFKLVPSKKAFKCAIKKYEINEPEELAGYDPITFLNNVKEIILKKIKEENSRRGIKVKLSLNCIMVKKNPATGKETIDNTHFSSKQEIMFEETDLEET